MRNNFIQEEFKKAGANNEKGWITTAQFRLKYGNNVILRSEKSLQLLK